jgi:hypothetical protein
MIAAASCGIPRTINILCDTALVYGFAASANQITPALVTMVIENKQHYGVLPLGPIKKDVESDESIMIPWPAL